MIDDILDFLGFWKLGEITGEAIGWIEEKIQFMRGRP